jgi:hypothetical protein
MIAPVRPDEVNGTESIASVENKKSLSFVTKKQIILEVLQFEQS